MSLFSLFADADITLAVSDTQVAFSNGEQDIVFEAPETIHLTFSTVQDDAKRQRAGITHTALDALQLGKLTFETDQALNALRRLLGDPGLMALSLAPQAFAPCAAVLLETQTGERVYIKSVNAQGTFLPFVRISRAQNAADTRTGVVVPMRKAS